MKHRNQALDGAAGACSSPPGRSDSALVGAVADGDNEALGQLYDRHAGLVFAIGVQILRDRAEAEDLVHAVFLEIWRKAYTYDARRSSVRAWLALRARSRALDQVRSARVSRAVDLDGPALERTPASTEATPERAVEHSRLYPLLAALSPGQRQILELSYFRGLSSREIAQRTGLPVGTVKSRAAAGLRQLRARLASPEGR